MSAIPAKYRLPERVPGMSTEEFLARYWGEQWPEVRELLGGDKRASSLGNPLGPDAELFRPLGTIEDFLEGLEGRMIDRYRVSERVWLFGVPGVSGASYLRQGGLFAALVSSHTVNPERKSLTPDARLSLTGLIEESAIGPYEVASALADRWEEILRSCAQAIVVFEPSPYGTYVLAPLMLNSNLLEPQVGEPGDYQRQHFAIPPIDSLDAPTSGGGFSGVLRIWPGEDLVLMSLYDQLHVENELFLQTMTDFFSALP